MLIYMFFHIFTGFVNIGVIDGIYEKLKREKKFQGLCFGFSSRSFHIWSFFGCSSFLVC